MSPATGRLSSFSISLGQSLTTGQSIGKVDLMGAISWLLKSMNTISINCMQGSKEHWKATVRNIMLLYPKYCRK